MKIPATRVLLNTNPVFKVEGKALTSFRIPILAGLRVFKTTVTLLVGENEVPIVTYYKSQSEARRVGKQIHTLMQQWDQYEERLELLKTKTIKGPSQVTLIQGAPTVDQEGDEYD